jgi:hypothetical protein
VCCLESAGEKFCEVRAATEALPTETSLLGIYLHGLPYTFAIGHIPSQFAIYYAHGNQRRGVTTRVSRLEQTLNKPKVVLVVGVLAVALNVLLYFGYFLPRMTPLIAHINPIGTSLPEVFVPDEGAKSDSEAGSKAAPESNSKSDPEASGELNREAGGGSVPESYVESVSGSGSASPSASPSASSSDSSAGSQPPQQQSYSSPEASASPGASASPESSPPPPQQQSSSPPEPPPLPEASPPLREANPPPPEASTPADAQY